MLLDFNYMISSVPKILKGVPVTLSIAGIAFIVGSFIGLLLALARINKVPVLGTLASIYVSMVRGTPLLVQIFLSYYGIPLILRYINGVYHLNFNVSGIPAIYFIYVSFSLNAGAYLSETIRAAILSVAKGQVEAAYSVGMTKPQVLQRIILPQAAVVALPSMGNLFIGMLKDTSLAFTAAVPEIMGQAKIIAGRTSQFFEVYMVAALIYWFICILFERVLWYMEHRLQKQERGVESDRS